MFFRPEIKEFTKNTLILTLFLTLVLNLSWGYLAPYLGIKASASNDTNFSQLNTTYLGNIATAVSLNVGLKEQETAKSGINLSNDIISIAEVLASPKEGEKRLIGNNMIAIQSYVNVLKTDIVALLDQATDRTVTLDEHIEILKSYYTKTADRLLIINDQITELNNLLKSTAETTTAAKTTMEEKYKAFDYSGVDTVINDYVIAKNSENRAKVYLVYLQRFERAYGILQSQNKILLDTLINNREALIKRSTVVIPDSGSDLLKKMGLIQTEEESKSTQTLE
ncbi:MAG: hypothetical protein PHY14_04105 [Candidatus Gracilibacteria bacterium]|nr:hypothetical protein [Candidatus Gracilibacteria bacterium]